MGISKIILLESMLLTAIAVFPSCGSDDETESASLTEGQKTEIDTAYDYINQIRANPSAFSEEIGDELTDRGREELAFSGAGFFLDFGFCDLVVLEFEFEDFAVFAFGFALFDVAAGLDGGHDTGVG